MKFLEFNLLQKSRNSTPGCQTKLLFPTSARQELLCSHRWRIESLVYKMVCQDISNPISIKMFSQVLSLIVARNALLSLVEGQHFFGPHAIGFGAALVGQKKNFQVATSIVSKRSTRSYSHQSFIQATPHGVTGYRTSTYTSTDHYQTANHVSYYQPNQYHYHSSPWSYRWGSKPGWKCWILGKYIWGYLKIG
jgi:hypothetical protein